MFETGNHDKGINNQITLYVSVLIGNFEESA